MTGPVTKNMREALERTYAATPDPKWVVAVGNCAADGGIFAGGYAVEGGVSRVVPVDLHIRGCPPSRKPCSKDCSRSFPAPDLFRRTAFPRHLIAKDDPGRGVIARAGHTPHVAIDTGIDQALRRFLLRSR